MQTLSLSVNPFPVKSLLCPWAYCFFGPSEACDCHAPLTSDRGVLARIRAFIPAHFGSGRHESLAFTPDHFGPSVRFEIARRSSPWVASLTVFLVSLANDSIDPGSDDDHPEVFECLDIGGIGSGGRREI